MWKHFKSLFVQNTCYCCDAELTNSEKCICLGCLAQIPTTGIGNKFDENELFFRFAGKIPLQGAYSHFFFEKKGKLQTIMQHLKYKDAPQIGTFLGEFLGLHLKDTEFFKEVDTIIPVPLHRKKQIKRGYNQAEKIGKGLSKTLEIPMSQSILKRIKQTSTQTAMSRDARWENVQTAFQAASHIPKSILIVDDIITTGATVEACLRTLLSAKQPPEKIRVVSVGMARKM